MKKFFPKEDPVGHYFGNQDQKYAGDYEIVGIVADAKYNNPRDEFRPMYFRPLTQFNQSFKEQQMEIAESSSLFPNSITVRFLGDPAARSNPWLDALSPTSIPI